MFFSQKLKAKEKKIREVFKDKAQEVIQAELAANKDSGKVIVASHLLFY